MNSETTFEKAYNVSCFAPLSGFQQQQTLGSPSYQQVNIFKKKKNVFFSFNILFRHVVIILMKDHYLHLVNLLDLFLMRQHYNHYDIMEVHHNESQNGKILFYHIFKNFHFHFSDECCIVSNGAISWSTYCNLYYAIRPPSYCDGYIPPSQGKLFHKMFFFKIKLKLF